MEEKGYMVESDFIFKGYRCIVIFNVDGYRCGYVGVPKEHPAYGISDYGTIPTSVPLTYGSNNENDYPVESDLWWFGFDFIHLGQGQDFILALKRFPDCKEYILEMKSIYDRHMGKYVVISKEEAEVDCKTLAIDLATMCSATNE